MDKIFRKKTDYEWWVEEVIIYPDELDEDGEPLEDGGETDVTWNFKEALESKRRFAEVEPEGPTRRYDIALVRETWSEANGLEDRWYAYLKDGKLPENFSATSYEHDGPKVPKQYHEEVAKGSK